MKNKIVKNIGLKIGSLAFAFFLWLFVVNIDDPVISRTYAGISVELLNENIVEAEGKCFEVLDNTNTINVVVTAKRSVLDSMSKDYIKATADFKALTFLDTIPIEVKSIRYADKIDSITTRTENVKLKLENVVEKSVPIEVITEGEVEEGYVLYGTSSNIGNVIIRGPQSLVDSIAWAGASVDLDELTADTVIICELVLHDEKGNPVNETKIDMTTPNIEVSVLVNDTKEIPITCGYSGNPAAGYIATGTVVTNPASVVVSGRGENYNDIDVIYISPDVVSVEGATDNVNAEVDISDYLPTGVVFADETFVPNINVTVGVAMTQRKTITVPLSNITVSNVPDGYIANIVDIGGSVEVEIQGLGDTFDRYSGDLAIGSVDAMTLIPRNPAENAEGALIHTGENDGMAYFDLPNGITLTQPVKLMVIVDYVGQPQELSEENSLSDETATLSNDDSEKDKAEDADEEASEESEEDNDEEENTDEIESDNEEESD